MEFTLTPEQEEIKGRARRLAREVFAPRAGEVDRTEEYPWDNVRALVGEGFMGLPLPAEYGGRGRSLLDLVLVVEEVAQVCASTARIVVDAGTAVPLAILAYGTEEQRRRWLPVIVQGDKPCICITEREAGSAATEMTTRAVKSGGHYILTGGKWFITGAGISHLHLVVARFGDGSGAEGLGALVVERGTPGLQVVRRIPTLGVRGIPEGEVLFQECPVPEENLLIPPGPGSFRRLMTAYNSQRVGSAAVALGIAQGALDLAVAYARERQQFGHPIAGFQGLRWMLVDMHTQVEASRLLLYRAASTARDGFPDPYHAARAKVFTAEMAIQVTNTALQVFGSYGYSREFPIERMVRDARAFTIAGGTAQVLRNLLARGLLGPEATPA